MTVAVLLWLSSFWLALLVDALLAWRRGRGPERIGAALFVAATIASILARSHQFLGFETALAAIDVGVLVVLWLISVYSRRWWAIIAAGAQLVTIIGHVGKALDPSFAPLAYARAAAFSAWPTVIALGCSMILRNRRRDPMPSWRPSLPPAARSILMRLRLD